MSITMSKTKAIFYYSGLTNRLRNKLHLFNYTFNIGPKAFWIYTVCDNDRFTSK